MVIGAPIATLGMVRMGAGKKDITSASARLGEATPSGALSTINFRCEVRVATACDNSFCSLRRVGRDDGMTIRSSGDQVKSSSETARYVISKRRRNVHQACALRLP